LGLPPPFQAWRPRPRFFSSDFSFPPPVLGSTFLLGFFPFLTMAFAPPLTRQNFLFPPNLFFSPRDLKTPTPNTLGVLLFFVPASGTFIVHSHEAGFYFSDKNLPPGRNFSPSLVNLQYVFLFSFAFLHFPRNDRRPFFWGRRFPLGGFFPYLGT